MRDLVAVPRLVRPIRLVVATLLAALVALLAGPTALAHDDIESSSPTSRSIIDAPISEVTIDFGEEISEDVALFMTYGLADGSVEDIGGVTTLVDATTAKLEFDEIERQGTYFVQYLAPVPADGHVIAGSISFTWGAPTAIDDENPDIRQSDPASRETLNDPISSATIQFDLEVTDLSMQLIYDVGDGETFDAIDGEIDQTSTRNVTFSFDEIDRTGNYFISYRGTAVIDGDEIAGAIPFVWGSPSSAPTSFPWLTFVPIALAILGIGAWFSYRRMAAASDGDADDEDATVDEDDAELAPA